MSLVPRYATIVKDLNVVNSGAKPGVLPLNLRFFVGFSFEDLNFLGFYCVAVI